MVPNSITSMIGTITANSVAAIARQSATMAAARRATPVLKIVIISRLIDKARCGTRTWRSATVCFRPGSRCCSQSRDKQRPLIEQPHDDDVTGATGAVLHGADEVAGPVDLAADRYAGERRVALHVHENVGASEQGGYLRAHHAGLELGLGIGGGLSLARHDRACGILPNGFKHLVCEKHDRSLDNRKQQCKEHRCDQRELDCSRAAPILPEAAEDI